MADYSTVLDSLKEMKELFENRELSDFSKCIAACLIIDAEIARITGVPTIADDSPTMQWAIQVADEYEAQHHQEAQ